MMIQLYSIKSRKILKEETSYHLLQREIRLAFSPDQLLCLMSDKSKFRITETRDGKPLISILGPNDNWMDFNMINSEEIFLGDSMTLLIDQIRLEVRESLSILCDKIKEYNITENF